LLPKNDFKKLLRNRHLRVRACVRACERATLLFFPFFNVWKLWSIFAALGANDVP
jgi:hypothetical protein